MTNLNEKINKKSEALIDDLLLSIVGQIRIFNFNENDTVRPGAIYGVSRCLRMLHEHFKTGYTNEAIKYLKIYAEKVGDFGYSELAELYTSGEHIKPNEIEAEKYLKKMNNHALQGKVSLEHNEKVLLSFLKSGSK